MSLSKPQISHAPLQTVRTHHTSRINHRPNIRRRITLINRTSAHHNNTHTRTQVTCIRQRPLTNAILIRPHSVRHTTFRMIAIIRRQRPKPVQRRLMSMFILHIITKMTSQQRTHTRQYRPSTLIHRTTGHNTLPKRQIQVMKVSLSRPTLHISLITRITHNHNYPRTTIRTLLSLFPTVTQITNHSTMSNILTQTLNITISRMTNPILLTNRMNTP